MFYKIGRQCHVNTRAERKGEAMPRQHTGGEEGGQVPRQHTGREAGEGCATSAHRRRRKQRGRGKACLDELHVGLDDREGVLSYKVGDEGDAFGVSGHLRLEVRQVVGKVAGTRDRQALLRQPGRRLQQLRYAFSLTPPRTPLS